MFNKYKKMLNFKGETAFFLVSSSKILYFFCLATYISGIIYKMGKLIV